MMQVSRVISMIINEMRFRPVGSVLMMLTIAAAAGLIVFFSMLAAGTEKETSRIQRDGGSNLRILPASLDLSQYHLAGHGGNALMPDEIVGIIAKEEHVAVNHMIPMLERRILLNDLPVLVTGVAPSVAVGSKSKMYKGVKDNTVEVGAVVARKLGVAEGDALPVMGVAFEVGRVLPEKGTADDIRVYAPLKQIQEALGLVGQVSEIRAIDCVSCYGGETPPLELLRTQLAEVAPYAQVIRETDRAQQRYDQRVLNEAFTAGVGPLVILTAGIVIAVLTLLNVRERRNEIGILRAVGHGSGMIGSLFIGKALVIGLVGAVVGAMIGGFVALQFGPDMFLRTGGKFAMDWNTVLMVSVLGPLLAALACVIPTALAVTEDPADVMSGR